MEIRIHSNVAKEIGLEKLTPYGLSKDSWPHRDVAIISLAEFDVKKVKALRKVLSTSEVRGVKVLIRDIDTWLLALDDASMAKPRSVRQFCPLLIRHIGRSPGHRIFRKTPDENWLCYYVDEIEFTPEDTRRDYPRPADVTMTLIYEDFGTRRKKKIVFFEDDCRNMAVSAALAAKNFVLEDDLKRAEYLAEMERFNAIHDKLGKQFYACGIGTEFEDGHGISERDSHAMTRDGAASRVVIDVFSETERSKSSGESPSTWFWTRESNEAIVKAVARIEKENERYALSEEDLADLADAHDVEAPEIDVPTHPFLCVFDLKRHLRLRIHISNLEEYFYDKKMIEKLVLPREHKEMVKMLIEHKEGGFRDLVAGKSGGAVVLLCGQPGTGKTLTAEIFAESEERALYSVQCSQLGIKAEQLENELLETFVRAKRWGAVMLLDEADVYIRTRASDLQQNAIVGVFLRVLEYQDNVLFLTTNRPDDVDDAIASRCIARLNYFPPPPNQQAEIWGVLSRNSDIDLPATVIEEIVQNNPGITGRDVKNYLKLANLFAAASNKKITSEVIDFIRQFSPTRRA